MSRQPHFRRHHPAPETNSPHPRQSRPLPTGHAAATQSQFQTPPSRRTPQLQPSSGPIQSVESAHPAAAAQAAIFSLFGRGVAGRPRTQMMDEDDEEESEEADDTFMRDGRRVTLDQMGNEVSVSDEEATGMVEEEGEGEVGEEEVEEDELMQDQGMPTTYWKICVSSLNH